VAQELPCKDCGATFVFEDEEQERYARDGFEPPKRCKACRAARRKDKPAPPPKPEPDAKKPLHEVQCGACGVLTWVPFEPTGLRPVYCEECFQLR
jgi:CxxC-x17-CxxC domain-containing protein